MIELKMSAKMAARLKYENDENEVHLIKKKLWKDWIF